MKHLRSIASVAFALALLTQSAHSKEKKEWQGYLIDRMCMKAVSNSLDPLDFVYHHTKDCLLMPTCRRQGFALYMAKQKKWLNLNKKGNELAEKVIRHSKRNSTFFVSVKGNVVKGILNVDAITEIENKKHK